MPTPAFSRSLVRIAFFSAALAATPILAESSVEDFRQDVVGPLGGPSLVTRLEGAYLILDWSGPAPEPAHFRIRRQDGRDVASRSAKRSVQGWIGSVRVAGWPPGLYRVEAEAGPSRAMATVLLP